MIAIRVGDAFASTFSSDKPERDASVVRISERSDFERFEQNPLPRIQSPATQVAGLTVFWTDKVFKLHATALEDDGSIRWSWNDIGPEELEWS
jgi:hypothetical protein